MWKISKEFRFEAAHKLPLHDGKCRNLHGHSFVGIATLQSDRLIKTGAKTDMVMDYADINKVLKPFVEECLDHQYLNESTGLENPTSEAIAQWIYQKLKSELPELYSIEIRETCTSSCVYYE